MATFPSLFAERFAIGATLGARRAARWSWPRRAVYVLASPVIPWVMFVRVLRATWKEIPPGRALGIVPGLLASGVAKAAGELTGYVGLRFPALEALGVHYEIHKVRYAGRGTY